MDDLPDPAGWAERLVWWQGFRWRCQGEERLEVPSVCRFLIFLYSSLLKFTFNSLSGYLLFPMFLITASIGGNYSDWTVSKTSAPVRALIFIVAPVVIVLGLFSRVRLGKMKFCS